MANFIDIVDCIFINKDKYYHLTEEDKITSFFIINRKFGKKYPNVSKRLNYKYIDKSSALDQWFLFFKNVNEIPKWYWDNDNIKKNKEVLKKSNNYDDIKMRYNLKEYDIDFLSKYFEDDLKENVKKIKKFD